MSGKDYRRLKDNDPMYEFVADAKRRNIQVCDSYDHNESEGCSNPGCFKFNGEKHCALCGATLKYLPATCETCNQCRKISVKGAR